MKRGFTLIELLVVIAILVVLSTAVVLVLNPVELIKQSRDATRISDLSTLNSAIALYLSDVSNPAWNPDVVNSTATCTVAGASGYPNGAATSSCSANVVTLADGSGWVRYVNFSLISGGSPLARLPIDPRNTIVAADCPGGGTTSTLGCFYGFKSGTSTGIYEIVANMESTKYRNGGTADVESSDGGNQGHWYEVGSNLTF
ncbi:prepilin-type N-terminal cleavage/methylation domain-containing protein [Candidatus Jorgensenbacteria bacterium]|nr:prepilin-type N-terminal cleavage/methylation domain-containing protein [Candidatus Jorgensenbacteria bacterium]